MEPISNVDRLVLLLRQRLNERAKTASSARKEVKQGAASRPAEGRGGIEALAEVEDIDDRQFGRALIQNLLKEQFGEAVINAARFQQVVDRVTETLERDDAGAKLLSRVVSELRVAAR